MVRVVTCGEVSTGRGVRVTVRVGRHTPPLSKSWALRTRYPCSRRACSHDLQALLNPFYRGIFPEDSRCQRPLINVLSISFDFWGVLSLGSRHTRHHPSTIRRSNPPDLHHLVQFWPLGSGVPTSFTLWTIHIGVGKFCQWCTKCRLLATNALIVQFNCLTNLHRYRTIQSVFYK